MIIFQNQNPSVLYLELINELMASGDECTPRGKKIKELRPVSIEYLDPLKRVPFLRGRRINPFFELAESLWIISGRSDVEFLDLFNKNMVSFSDDGKFFNASYGERIRFYGKNDLHKEIYNPVDQLEDCYIKLLNDKDTRQAVIVISHPQFDNSKYTIGEQGKDIACNLVITFKIRDDKLNMTVFNRSNDVIWGTFTNLCQFSTIQELLATWLGLEVGTYHQITDSLHIYTDTYGSKGNEAIFESHSGLENGSLSPEDILFSEEQTWWEFSTEPRMSLSREMFSIFLDFFWKSIAPKLYDYDDFISNHENVRSLLKVIRTDPEYLPLTDDYWRMVISSMFCYRYVRCKDYAMALEILRDFIPDSSWKVSMLYFIKSLIKNHGDKYNLKDYEQTVLDFVDRSMKDDLNGYNTLREYLEV